LNKGQRFHPKYREPGRSGVGQPCNTPQGSADVVNAHFGLGLSDYDIVAMVTCNAARILRWDGRLGTIERTPQKEQNLPPGIASAIAAYFGG
jgi:hypothetical protein